MITQQTQIKINLPLALKEYLESKAKKYDMPIAGYVKHLILKDVADMEYPTFRLSDRSEAKLEHALKTKTKAKNVTSTSTYLESL